MIPIPKKNILQSSFKAAYFNIIFQIFCRCITFGINAFIIRHVGKEILGIMNIRLLLLESTILFLSREAICRSALSVTSQHRNKCSWPQVVNQIWLTVPISCFLAIPCLYLWLYVLSPVTEDLRSQYVFACFAMAVSCCLELCAETPVFLARIYCFIKLTICMDTIHILVRSLVFLILIFWDSGMCIIAFGVAQFVSALAVVFGYYSYFHYFIKRNNELKIGMNHEKINTSSSNNDLRNHERKDSNGSSHYDDETNSTENNSSNTKNFDKKLTDEFPFRSTIEMLPGVLENQNKIFNHELQFLTFSFIKQSVLKQILTEGEKYVMSLSPVLTFSQQAIYDTVNNIGSLAARFLFRPVEDSAYFYFTQTISRDLTFDKQNNKKISEALFVLKTLMKIMVSIGLIIFVFGQSFAEIVLYIYGGANFIAGGLPEQLLRWHCLTILLLGLNGITEGFMLATNASLDIDKFNYFMAIFSLIFLLFTYVLTNLCGPVGFILANCTNMLCRILYSLGYIKKSFINVKNCNPFDSILPGKYFSTILIILGLLCNYVVNQNFHILLSLSIGGLCFLSTLYVWFLENKEIVNFLIDLKNKDK